MKRNFYSTTTSLAGLLVLSIASSLGCSGDDASTDDDIKVGWIGPLTGPVAPIGVDNSRGVELAVADLNARGGIAGHQIKLLIEDSASNADKAVQIYERMRDQDKVDMVLTKDYGSSLVLAPKADADGMVVVNTIDTSEQLAKAGDYLFAVGIYDEGIGQALAMYVAQQLKKTKVAVITLNADFMKLVKESFVTRFAALGGAAPVLPTYTFSTTDYQSLLQPVVDAGIDTVILLGFEEAGLIIAKAAELKLGLTILGADTFTGSMFFANAGSAAEGVYLTSWSSNTAEYTAWLNSYMGKYGSAPEQPLFSAVGYDAMFVVADAMKRGGRSGQGLRDALYQIKGMTGITGVLEMSADGAVRTVLEQMFRIVNGKAVQL
jgi:branched-chain amino acid transport system substrate-binding protein